MSSFTSAKPGPADGLALSTALLLQLTRDKAVLPGRTYAACNSECYRLGATRSQWNGTKIREFVLDAFFAKLGAQTIGSFFTKRAQELPEEDSYQSFVEELLGQAITYHLAKHAKVSQYAEAVKLAGEAKLDDVLQCTQLGGRASFSFAALVPQATFDIGYAELVSELNTIFIDEIAFVGLDVSPEQRETCTWQPGARQLAVKQTKSESGRLSSVQPQRQPPQQQQDEEALEPGTGQQKRQRNSGGGSSSGNGGLADIDEDDVDVLTRYERHRVWFDKEFVRLKKSNDDVMNFLLHESSDAPAASRKLASFVMLNKDKVVEMRDTAGFFSKLATAYQGYHNQTCVIAEASRFFSAKLVPALLKKQQTPAPRFSFATFGSPQPPMFSFATFGSPQPQQPPREPMFSFGGGNGTGNGTGMAGGDGNGNGGGINGGTTSMGGGEGSSSGGGGAAKQVPPPRAAAALKSAPPRAQPPGGTEMSRAMSIALPIRPSAGGGAMPPQRITEIRDELRHTLLSTNGMVAITQAKEQAAERPDPTSLYSEKPKGERGRMLPPGQWGRGLQQVKGKLTSKGARSSVKGYGKRKDAHGDSESDSDGDVHIYMCRVRRAAGPEAAWVAAGVVAGVVAGVAAGAGAAGMWVWVALTATMRTSSRSQGAALVVAAVQILRAFGMGL